MSDLPQPGFGPMEGVDPAPAPQHGDNQLAAATAARLAREAQLRVCPVTDEPTSLDGFIVVFNGSRENPPQEWLDAPAASAVIPSSVPPPAEVNPSSGAADIPPELLCAITYEIMLNPVVTPSGHTVDKSALERHLNGAPPDGPPPNPTDPFTRNHLTIEMCPPNRAIQELIERLSGMSDADRAAGAAQTGEAIAAASARAIQRLNDEQIAAAGAAVTEEDFSFDQEQALKEARAKADAEKKLEKKQKEMRKKKKTIASNITKIRNTVSTANKTKEGSQEMIKVLAKQLGFDDSVVQMVAKDPEACINFAKKIQKSMKEAQKTKRDKEKLNKHEKEYREINQFTNTPASELLTTEDVQREMDAAAPPTPEKEEGINFDFLEAGGDPSVWEKKFLRKKDDEDDDLKAFAFALAICVPDILDYLPAPPTEQDYAPPPEEKIDDEEKKEEKDDVESEPQPDEDAAAELLAAIAATMDFTGLTKPMLRNVLAYFTQLRTGDHVVDTTLTKQQMSDKIVSLLPHIATTSLVNSTSN